MLTVDFTGNLGNHMWQYAVTRYVAELNGYEYGFNPHPSHDYYGGAEQMYFMDIDYGKIHNLPYGAIAPGIEHTWIEEFIHKTYPNGDSVDYHPFQAEVFDIPDNTKLVIRCCQDARYVPQQAMRKYFKVKDEYEKQYSEILKKNGLSDILNYDYCCLNVRGGEYKGIPNVLLNLHYWNGAMRKMQEAFPNMKFFIVTDDVEYCRNQFTEIPAFHFDIGMDYWIINNSKNLILSNSSFAIIPAWTNKKNPIVIAPKYWARHNVSTGYWASSDVWTFDFIFMDKDGKL